MTIIIDPPVSMYSSPEEIRAWLRELREQKKTAEGVEHSKAYDRAITEAEGWIERASR